MPQLDPNTFTYQYFVIIFILVAAYTLLSYIALPALLRIIIIRDMFSKSSRSISTLSNLLSNRVTNISLLQDPFVSIFSSKISILLNKFVSILTTTNFFLISIFSQNNFKNNVNNNSIITNFYNKYLFLFLLANEENND